MVGVLSNLCVYYARIDERLWRHVCIVGGRRLLR